MHKQVSLAQGVLCTRAAVQQWLLRRNIPAEQASLPSSPVNWVETRRYRCVLQRLCPVILENSGPRLLRPVLPLCSQAHLSQSCCRAFSGALSKTSSQPSPSPSHSIQHPASCVWLAPINTPAPSSSLLKAQLLSGSCICIFHPTPPVQHTAAPSTEDEQTSRIPCSSIAAIDRSRFAGGVTVAAVARASRASVRACAPALCLRESRFTRLLHRP